MGFQSDAARRSYFDAYDATEALSPVPLEAATVATPFGSTHVTVAGSVDGPPLVMLHGKHCSSTMWLDLLPGLVATRRIYLVDAIGELGRSEATRMMHGPRDIVVWMSAVLDGLGIDRCAIVGLSNGSYQGCTFAMARPERVERLAMLAPAATVSGIRLSWWWQMVALLGRKSEKHAQFWRLHSVGRERSVLQQKFDEQILVGFAAARYAVLDAFPRKYSARQLAALTMPVLAVFAGNDVIHEGQSVADVTRRLLPGAQVEVLQNCGHMMTFDRQDAVAALLADFLANGTGS
jgi:pimeloyl-ACP methyl ester carboxylesterase